jgi:hypothetical protein
MTGCVFCASRMVQAGRRDFFEAHNYWRWILRALFHTGKQTRYFRMASSKFTSTKESQLKSIRWEGVTFFWDHKGVILEHYLEQRETMNSERYSDMLRNQLKPAIQTKRRGLLSSGVSAAWQRPTSYSETDSGFKIGDVTLSVIFTRFVAQWFSSLLAFKRRSTWTSLQIGWRGKGGGAWLAGTATKRLLPRNLCLSGMNEACKMWWGLYWRLMPLYHINFCNKSLYIIFLVFIWITFVRLDKVRKITYTNLVIPYRTDVT